jgi:hypothetical protein
MKAGLQFTLRRLGFVAIALGGLGLLGSILGGLGMGSIGTAILVLLVGGVLTFLGSVQD